MTSPAEASRTPALGAHYRLAVSRHDTMVVAVTPGGEVVRGPGFTSAEDAALLACERLEGVTGAHRLLEARAKRMATALRWYRVFGCLAALALLLALSACSCHDHGYCPPPYAPRAG